MRRDKIKMAVAVGTTLFVLSTLYTWNYFQEQKRLITQIDNHLYAAASAIPYVIKDDFHDRAIDAKSINPKEDKNNTLSLSALNNRLGTKFLYSVIRDREGNYRLSSSSATDEELKSGKEVRYFTAYPEVSDLLKQHFENSNTHFSRRPEPYHPVYIPAYSDRWGTYRSIFIPMSSPRGSHYVVCADMDITYVTALLRQNLLRNILEFAIYTLALLPIIITYFRAVKRKTQEYQHVHKLYLDQSELSVTDPLTNIGNRLKLDNELLSALDHNNNHAQPFGLVMIDIDHFKSINDQYGHQIGDVVLQQFAKILKQHSRSTDIVGRWGGDELMIIYHNTNLEGAYNHAEKLRKIIADSEFEHGIRMSASFGVTQPAPGISFKQLLECADEALYNAKGEGRNRTVKYQCTQMG